MTKATAEERIRTLLRRKNELEDMLAIHRRSLMHGVTEVHDFVDKSDREVGQSVTTLEVASITRQINEIDDCVGQLKAGNVKASVCIDCEEEIDSKRLELVPQARRCCACQELQEEQAMFAPRRRSRAR